MGGTPPPRASALDRAGLAAAPKRGSVEDALGRIADWDERYEALRAAWLDGRRTGGCAVVRRSGLLAWMHAEARWEAGGRAAAPLPHAPAGRPAADDELVIALVELLARRLQEGAS